MLCHGSWNQGKDFGSGPIVFIKSWIHFFQQMIQERYGKINTIMWFRVYGARCVVSIYLPPSDSWCWHYSASLVSHSRGIFKSFMTFLFYVWLHSYNCFNSAVNHRISQNKVERHPDLSFEAWLQWVWVFPGYSLWSKRVKPNVFSFARRPCALIVVSQSHVNAIEEYTWGCESWLIMAPKLMQTHSQSS